MFNPVPDNEQTENETPKTLVDSDGNHWQFVDGELVPADAPDVDTTEAKPAVDDRDGYGDTYTDDDGVEYKRADDGYLRAPADEKTGTPGKVFNEGPMALTVDSNNQVTDDPNKQ